MGGRARARPLVSDGHTTGGDEAATVDENLHTVMRWVAYADVHSTAATAEEVDFAALA